MKRITAYWEAFIGKRRFLIFLFSISAITSFLVLTSAPFGYFSGDLQTYLALGREIAANGMIMPSTNTIHYPGSSWVYPPVIPEVSALIYLASPGYSIILLSAFSISAVALTSIPLFLLIRNLFGKKSAATSGILYAFYFPSMYEETWGGLPQLVAFLLILSVLALITHPGQAATVKWKTAKIAALSFILPFVHDLSSMIFLASLFITMLIFVFPGRRINSYTKPVIVSVISMVAGAAIWYAPRLWWVFDSAFPSKNYVYSGLAASLPSYSPSSSIFSSFYSLQQPSAFLSSLTLGWILIVLFFLLAAASIFIALGKKDRWLMFPLLILPASLMVYDIFDPVLFVRFSYYVYLYSFVLISPILLRGILIITDGLRAITNPKKLVLPLILAAILVFSSFGGMVFERSSHSYFGLVGGSVDNNTYALKAASVLSSNYASGVVAATGQIGFLLMGEYGIPVDEYQPLNYLTQPVEWKESAAAYVLIYEPELNETHTLNLITEFSIFFVVMYTSMNVSHPSFYNQIYTNEFYTIYTT